MKMRRSESVPGSKLVFLAVAVLISGCGEAESGAGAGVDEQNHEEVTISQLLIPNPDSKVQLKLNEIGQMSANDLSEAYSRCISQSTKDGGKTKCDTMESAKNFADPTMARFGELKAIVEDQGLKLLEEDPAVVQWMACVRNAGVSGDSLAQLEDVVNAQLTNTQVNAGESAKSGGTSEKVDQCSREAFTSPSEAMSKRAGAFDRLNTAESNELLQIARELLVAP